MIGQAKAMMSIKTVDKLMHVRARLHFLNSNSSFPSSVAIHDRCCVQFADSACNFAPFLRKKLQQTMHYSYTGNICCLVLQSSKSSDTLKKFPNVIKGPLHSFSINFVKIIDCLLPQILRLFVSFWKCQKVIVYHGQFLIDFTEIASGVPFWQIAIIKQVLFGAGT